MCSFKFFFHFLFLPLNVFLLQYKINIQFQVSFNRESILLLINHRFVYSIFNAFKTKSLNTKFPLYIQTFLINYIKLQRLKNCKTWKYRNFSFFSFLSFFRFEKKLGWDCKLLFNYSIQCSYIRFAICLSSIMPSNFL